MESGDRLGFESFVLRVKQVRLPILMWAVTNDHRRIDRDSIVLPQRCFVRTLAPGAWETQVVGQAEDIKKTELGVNALLFIPDHIAEIAQSPGIDLYPQVEFRYAADIETWMAHNEPVLLLRDCELDSIFLGTSPCWNGMVSVGEALRLQRHEHP